MPRVSVLMPAYNVSEFVDEAIQSILNQTYDDWELIVVNDCSTDDTVAKVEQYSDPRIKLFHTPQNMKLCRALNFGLEHCSGEFVARLDSDDRSAPQRLDIQVRTLDAHPEWALIGTASQTIDEDGNRLGKVEFPRQPEVIRFAFAFFNTIRHSSVMFRSSIVRELGGYPVKWHDIEDFGLWAVMVLNGHQLANIPNVLCDYRQRAGSMMKSAGMAAKQTGAQPRRATAKSIYAACAANSGVPIEIAERWGDQWSRVEFPIADEKVDVAELRTLLRCVLKARPSSIGARNDLGRLLSKAYSAVFRFSVKQRDFYTATRVAADALASIGPIGLLQAVLRKL